MNRGSIKGKTYIKKVNFSSAVLWKDKQLSLPMDIFTKIKENGCTLMDFVDDKKNETWRFKVEDVDKAKILKQEGQEPQYYFSINFAKKIKNELAQ